MSATSVARGLAAVGWLGLTAAAGPTAGWAAWPPPVPAQLLLTVRETAGVTRSGEVVRSGVPVPRGLDFRNPGLLTLVDAGATPVPAEFQVLARWDAARTADAPIQWLLVTFPATVPAGGAATYRVVTDGSAGPNPAPPVAVGLTQLGNQVTVTTGAARFVLGGTPDALFDEVRLADDTLLVNGSTLSATANGTLVGHSTTRRVLVEHSGPLTAIVVIDGAYDLPAVGGGLLASRRRYVFTAGSPTALVRHVVTWEGDLCGLGSLVCGPGPVPPPNAVRIQRVRDVLGLAVAPPLSVMAVGDFQAAAVQGPVGLGQAAQVRQLLRTVRTDPLVFDVNVAGLTAGGTRADGGMLAAGGAAGTVAVALNHMHRYEPQALRVLADGSLAVDVADDQAWLGMRQGLFATLAVSALPPGASRADLDRLVWAPLNRPLRAWPEAAWFAASEAVDEFPVGPLPASLASYDTLVEGVLTRTLQQIDAKGLAGLMTFGVYPRTWDHPFQSDEIDCAPGTDPTPAETWDDPYWCATWTDYHSTIATAPIWAMRTGQVEWLDELALPGALRMLHTQIMQCAFDEPDIGNLRCGRAPTGYGGYRADNNGSHQYWDNLFLYYWLTGDGSALETLRQGAESIRGYFCPGRPGALPCLPDTPPTDLYAGMTGRVAVQWSMAFRLVGLASDDPSFLEDYRSAVARALTLWYVEAEQAGARYGFSVFDTDPLDGPGTDSTDQLWMVSLYDMNRLYRYQVDTMNALAGSPPIQPSAVQVAWARTLVRFGSTVAPGGDGTAAGPWPNTMLFTWANPRIGGALTNVVYNGGDPEPQLYDTGKSTLTGVLVRASDLTPEAALRLMGEDLVALALNAALNVEFSPLGKIQGEYLARLHAAVARLAARATGGGGPLSLVVRGLDDGIYHNRYDGATWSGWTALPGATADIPALASSGAGILDLVVRGIDNGVYHNHFGGGTWSGWTALPGATADIPALASSGAGVLDLVVRGIDNGVYHNHFGGGTWSGWTALPGATADIPALASSGAGVLDLVVRGIDDGVYHNRFNGVAWTGWLPVPGATADIPALAPGTDGTLHLVVRGVDSGIYHNRFNGVAWTGWLPVPGATADIPALAPGTGGTLHLVVRGVDNGIYHNRFDGIRWTGWTAVGGSTASRPALVAE